MARPGTAWLGMAWLGKARQGKDVYDEMRFYTMRNHAAANPARRGKRPAALCATFRTPAEVGKIRPGGFLDRTNLHLCVSGAA